MSNLPGHHTPCCIFFRLGKKLGITQIFLDDGTAEAVVRRETWQDLMARDQ